MNYNRYYFYTIIIGTKQLVISIPLITFFVGKLIMQAFLFLNILKFIICINFLLNDIKNSSVQTKKILLIIEVEFFFCIQIMKYKLLMHKRYIISKSIYSLLFSIRHISTKIYSTNRLIMI